MPIARYSIPVLIAGLGMFAVPEMVKVLRKRTTMSSTPALGSGAPWGFGETFGQCGEGA